MIHPFTISRLILETVTSVPNSDLSLLERNLVSAEGIRTFGLNLNYFLPSGRIVDEVAIGV